MERLKMHQTDRKKASSMKDLHLKKLKDQAAKARDSERANVLFDRSLEGVEAAAAEAARQDALSLILE